MQFNGGKVSVSCVTYVPVGGESIVEVEAEKPFTLVVKTNYSWCDTVISVPAGISCFRI